MTTGRRMGGALLGAAEVVLALAVVVGLWQLAAVWVGKAMLVPPPLGVARAWLELLADTLPTDALTSLGHLAAGYGLGVGTGLAGHALRRLANARGGRRPLHGTAAPDRGDRVDPDRDPDVRDRQRRAGVPDLLRRQLPGLRQHARQSG